MKSFAISRFQAGLVQSAFYMGYFLLAMPAALMMRKVGYIQDSLRDLVCTRWAYSCSGPRPSWDGSFFLLALFVIASGLSFL